MRTEQCPALAFGGLHLSGNCCQAVLHRLDGSAQRHALEGLGQRGVANLHASEQAANRRVAVVWIDDQASDRAVLDARPDQLEAGPQLLREFVAERLQKSSVVRVEYERGGIQAQQAQLVVVELGEYGHQRQQPPQRLEIGGQHHCLVAERIQAPIQGLDRRRETIQLGAQRARVERRLAVGTHGSGVRWAIAQQRFHLSGEEPELFATRQTVVLDVQLLESF